MVTNKSINGKKEGEKKIIDTCH